MSINKLMDEAHKARKQQEDKLLGRKTIPVQFSHDEYIAAMFDCAEIVGTNPPNHYIHISFVKDYDDYFEDKYLEIV